MPTGMRRTNETNLPEMQPVPMIKLAALHDYHNAGIAGGVGIHWSAGEEREVSWAQYQQIMADDPGGFTRTV